MVHRRPDVGVQHRLDGERRERTQCGHQCLPLRGGNPRLAEPSHHALDGGPVGERLGRGANRREERRIRNGQKQPVESADRFRDRDHVLEREQARRHRLKLLHRRSLGIQGLGRFQTSDGPLHLHGHRHDVGAERAARAPRHRIHRRRGQGKRRGRGGRGGQASRELGGRRRVHRRRRGKPLSASPDRQGNLPQRRIVGLHASRRHAEQRQHMLRRETRVHLDAPQPAGVEQARELCHLAVAREQVLPVPMQSGRADLPLQGPDGGEGRQRSRDMA